MISIILKLFLFVAQKSSRPSRGNFLEGFAIREYLTCKCEFPGCFPCPFEKRHSRVEIAKERKGNKLHFHFIISTSRLPKVNLTQRENQLTKTIQTEEDNREMCIKAAPICGQVSHFD